MLIETTTNGKIIPNEYPGSNTHSLLKRNKIEWANKLEGIPFEIEPKELNTILNNSEFQRLRRKLSNTLIDCGVGALCLIPFQGSYIVDVLYNILYSSIGKFLVEITGTTGKTHVWNGMEVLIYTRYYKENKQVVMYENFIWDEITNKDGKKTSKKIILDNFIFGTQMILPVEIFYNNENKQSDEEYFGIVGELKRLDYLDEQIRPQYELQKTMLAINTNFSDNIPKELLSEIEHGRGVIEETSFNSKIKEGTSIIPSQGAVLSHLALITALENRIREKLGIKAVAGTELGTNKHNLEMITKDQYQIEILLARKEIREIHWQAFFDMLCLYTKIPPISISLQISELDQAKLDMLEATIASEKEKSVNTVKGDNNGNN